MNDEDTCDLDDVESEEVGIFDVLVPDDVELFGVFREVELSEADVVVVEAGETVVDFRGVVVAEIIVVVVELDEEEEVDS
ncbi:hypothetical protein L5515_005005 [Caenorhabditis briggsae]|uniref:Uncharacterized protein n=1 Tax=Caenorhabditis briggsae TaxID=6238 RepID=A0AAE9JEC7_CAEBR|nr:hypothetical protein L5515_005005 [Caenorhabditis briggsae]